jgi:hypothetical protein
MEGVHHLLPEAEVSLKGAEWREAGVGGQSETGLDFHRIEGNIIRIVL